MKLLIIEDEPELLKSLAKGFQKKGYIVETCDDGAEGFELYLLNRYDLIILDLNLPTMDGLEVLSAIRERENDKQQRLLILSARSEIDDRINGLDMGANDYLPKPFDFGELDARVRNLLRREVIQQQTVISYGDIILNSKFKQVKYKNDIVELSPKEYAILEYLMFHNNAVISAETLIEQIWGSDADLFSEAIKVHISNLRRKLKNTCKKDIIVTVRGHGYRIGEEKN